jgi:hypothetical protein
MTPQRFILNKFKLEITINALLVLVLLIGGSLIFKKGMTLSDTSTIIVGIAILVLGISWVILTFFDFKVYKISCEYSLNNKMSKTEAVLIEKSFQKHGNIMQKEKSGIIFYFEKQKNYWKSFPSISSKKMNVWIFHTNEGVEFCAFCSGYRGHYPSIEFTYERIKILKILRENL